MSIRGLARAVLGECPHTQQGSFELLWFEVSLPFWYRGLIPAGVEVDARDARMPFPQVAHLG